MKKTATKQKEDYFIYDKRETDLPGEEWRGIPGLGDFFLISNYGRVKRLARDILTSDGKIRRIPERILTADESRIKNRSVGDELIFVVQSLMIDGRSYKFSTARMVYCCFCEEFDLEDYTKLVVVKDRDGRNIHPSNLEMVSVPQKQQRIFEKGRIQRDYKNCYREFLDSGKIKSSDPQCRQVSQYTAEGKFMRTFPSIRVASKILGIRDTKIVSVLKKRQVISAGYFWSYEARPFIDVAAIRQANQLSRQKKVGVQVSQYNLEGTRINVYSAIMTASNEAGVNKSDIYAVLTGKQKTAGGFIWKKGKGSEKLI